MPAPCIQSRAACGKSAPTPAAKPTLPATHRSLQGLHTGIHPEEPNLARLQALRAITRVLSIETWRSASSPLRPEALRAVLQHAVPDDIAVDVLKV